MICTSKTTLYDQRGQYFSNSRIQRLLLSKYYVHISSHNCRIKDPSNLLNSNLRRPIHIVAAQNTTKSPTSSNATAAPTTTTSTHLTQIQIENFALVDNQSVTLHPGLNVITGESGSGKSVFIEAINQLLGAPSDTTMIRAPSPFCTIQGTFSIAPKDLPVLTSLLQDTLGLPAKAITSLTTTHSMIIQREVSLANSNDANKKKKKGGGGGGGKVKSKCTINGASVPLKTVRELSKCLVDMNGQNSSLSMRDSAHQLAALDSMVAGTGDNSDNSNNNSSSVLLLSEFKTAWKELQETRSQLIAFQALSNEEERQELQDMVDQVFRHIGCIAGEDRLLKGQMKKLDAQRASSERCQMATVSLGEGGVSDALVQVEQNIRSVLIDQQRVAAAAALERTAAGGGNDEEEDDEENEGDDDDEESLLEDILESLCQAREAILTARDGIKRYAKTHRFSQQEYDEMSSRLEQLTKLCKQYDAIDVDELIQRASAVEAQLDAFYQMEGRREEIESNAEVRLKRVQMAAVALSKGRRQAAQALGPAVTAVLAELAMASAQFDVRLQWDKVADIHPEEEEDSISVREIIIKYGNAIPIPADLASQCGQQPGIYKIKQGDGTGTGGGGGGVGLDTAEFVFAAGPGEPLKSLSSVASGGEAARIVLALKAAPSSLPSAAAAIPSLTSSPLSEQQPAITVLDEIDSSIGSRLGLVIGKILRRMARGHNTGTTTNNNGANNNQHQQQVVCISHLPQVAAHGQHHIVVRKSRQQGDGSSSSTGKEGRVVTRFKVLDNEQERLDEVAAMLGLHEDAARELMSQVEK